MAWAASIAPSIAARQMAGISSSLRSEKCRRGGGLSLIRSQSQMVLSPLLHLHKHLLQFGRVSRIHFQAGLRVLNARKTERPIDIDQSTKSAKRFDFISARLPAFNTRRLHEGGGILVSALTISMNSPRRSGGTWLKPGMFQSASSFCTTAPWFMAATTSIKFMRSRALS